MLLKEVISHIETLAPRHLQESWDNSGLQVGDIQQEITSILTCLDVTEAVVDEAIQKGCQLILSHHPLIFNGIKRIVGENYIQRCITKALKNDIAIYSAHTSLDNSPKGINFYLANKLGLKNIQILAPKQDCLYKLVTYVPQDHAEKVRNALFNAGCGQIGNYSHCSYNLDGLGSFKAGENTNPFVGNIGEIHFENETRIETILPKQAISNAIKSLINAHPYEEPAYDLFKTDIQWQQAGLGVIGELENPMTEEDFLLHTKTVLSLNILKHSPYRQQKVQKIAICSGSGADFIKDAISQHADAYITGDVTYHRFFDCEKRILLADIGHAESELPTKRLFKEEIGKIIGAPTVIMSESECPPAQWL